MSPARNIRPDDPDGERGFDAAAAFPAIQINRDLPEVVEDVLDALTAANRPPRLFVRGNRLVRVDANPEDGGVVTVLNENALLGLIVRCATYFRTTDDGSRRADPPAKIAKDILNLGDWPFPPLKRLSEVPIVRPDGTVRTEPGYDAGTQLYYAPRMPCPIAIPERPRIEDLRAAVAVWDELFCDFPFVDGASRANAFAFMLTPLIRHLVPFVPIAAFNKPTPGTGADLLVDVIWIGLTGADAPGTSAPRDEAEWRRTIFSLLNSQGSLILFDNVAAHIDSAALNAALTKTRYQDRSIRTSDAPIVPQVATWAITANNLSLTGELARRVYVIRLDAGVPDPSLRSGFRHPRLREWARGTHTELLRAALIMVRAWFAAGRPPRTGLTLGSFEEWVEMVGGILAVCEIEGFLANRDEALAAAAPDDLEWEEFLRTIFDRLGDRPFHARELVAPDGQMRDEFADVVPTEVQADGRAKLSVALGRAFKRRRDRPHGEDRLRIVSDAYDGRAKVNRWRVMRG